MDERDIDIGQRLAACRLRRGLSQGTVARLSGLAVSYISRIETSGVNPTFRTVLKLAHALEVDVDEFAGPGPVDKRRRGACPISDSGHCVLDLIHCEPTGGGKVKRDHYTPQQVRCMRMLGSWIRTLGPNRRRAVEKFLLEATGLDSTPTGVSTVDTERPGRGSGVRKARRKS